MPNRWIGLCALVRMKTSVVLVYDRVNEMLGLDVEKGRVKDLVVITSSISAFTWMQ